MQYLQKINLDGITFSKFRAARIRGGVVGLEKSIIMQYTYCCYSIPNGVENIVTMILLEVSLVTFV